MLKKYCRTVIAILVTNCALTMWGQDSDIIQPIGKAPLRGTIKQMNSTEIKISVGGRERTVPVNVLKNVAFRGEPSELRQARRDVSRGNYQAALKKLDKVDAKSIRNDYVNQDLAFYAAMANAQLALIGVVNPKPVAVQMLEFKKNNPDNYHFYDAVDVLGQLSMVLGKNKLASQFFSELAHAPWQDYQVRASFLEAKAFLRREQYGKALKKFQLVRDSDIKGPNADHQIALAEIGMAVSLAHTGDPTQGLQLAETVLNNTGPDDVEIQARGYNALGICYLKKKKSKDALLAFLHTDLLYSSQRDAHAEALFHLTNLWAQIDRKERAIKARSMLKSRYANSLWAAKL